MKMTTKQNNNNKNKFEKETSLKKNRKEAKIVRRVLLITIGLLSIILLLGVYMGYNYVSKGLSPVDEDDQTKIEIEIPIGSSNSQIADILEDNDIIHDGRIFKYYVKFKNQASFQAGTYTLSKSMDIDDIIEELQTGKVMEEPIHRITVPEGRDIEDIASIMANKLDFSEDEFLEEVTDESFIKELIEAYPNTVTDEVLEDDLIYALEGYLFAGTYDFYEENPTPADVIKEMISRTQSIVLENEEAVEDSELTVHEILTLASIVEKESKFTEDRPKVAQVFFNRLDEGMPLQSDITALYALREHKTIVSYDDIDVDSPYNTYKTKTLPPGPISSPSLESILGVLNPEGEEFTELYFYARPNGETFYRHTLDEHNAVVNEYRQEWYDLQEEAEETEENE